MVRHFFSRFLHDEAEYRASERFWLDLWNQIDSRDRFGYGWKAPWFEPLPPDLSEGNPIFSAVSVELRRGIRIIQDEPKEGGLELVAYPDTFDGPIHDPRSIKELVVSCALSDVAARVALEFMRPWVADQKIRFDFDNAYLRHSHVPDFISGDYMVPPAA